MLVQYVRDGRRNRIGVVVCRLLNGKPYLGWSKCCKLDRFDKARGLGIAMARAQHERSQIPITQNDDEFDEFFHYHKVPSKVRKVIKQLNQRALRYYKVTQPVTGN